MSSRHRPSPIAAFVAAVVVVVASLAASPVRAQGLELHTDPVLEVPFTTFAAAGWFALEGSKASLTAQCRFCERDAAGNDDVNAVDATVRAALKWDDIQRADLWSNVAAAGSGASALGGLFALELADDATARFPQDALLVAEAVTFAGALNAGVKVGVARQRPFVHAGSTQERDTSDDNVSFYSGHASATFSLAAATGTIATLRGYRYAPVVWASGLTLAALTSYLRIAADRHYFTDVVVGAVVGTAIGVAVPLLLHPRAAPLSPAPLSAAATATAPSLASAAPAPILFALTWAL